MKSDVSALMDSALEDRTGQRLVDRLGGDAELRQAWSRYHLIGDALRGTPECGVDITARVLARLVDEPAVIAPNRQVRGPQRSRFSRHVLPLAASIVGIGAVGWVAHTLNPPSEVTVAAGNAPLVTLQRGDRTLASAPAPAEIVQPASVSQVRQYLFAHQGYSMESSIQGVAPYVRTVSDEREGAAR
jgi:sigma-E factor negative regulatory protein RseA